jgi:hypothetical protein
MAQHGRGGGEHLPVLELRVAGNGVADQVGMLDTAGGQRVRVRAPARAGEEAVQHAIVYYK